MKDMPYSIKRFQTIFINGGCFYSCHDPDHSTDEQRYIDIDVFAAGRVLVMVYAERSSNIRLVSCRKATSTE
jgi:uncharacterized DUF497 family protein